MEPVKVLYDEYNDIFHNDEYLKILKTKDYVYDFKKTKYELIEPVYEKHIPKIKKEKFKGFDQKNTKIKNELIMHFYKKFSINKNLTFDQSTPATAIAFNYISQKYAKQRLHNKNIFVVRLASEHVAKKYIIFNGYYLDYHSYVLYKYGHNNNIYTLLSRKSKRKKIKNNKNTLQILNDNTINDILYKKNYTTMMNGIKNKKFDFMFIDLALYHQYHQPEYIIKYLILFIHTIITKCSKNGQVQFNMRINDIVVKNLIIPLADYFNNVKIIGPKYRKITTKYMYILFDGFNVPSNNKLQFYDKIIKNPNFFDINTMIVKCVETKIPKDYYKFIESLEKIKIKIVSLYQKLVKYFTDDKYNDLKKIIMYNIKKKQLYYADLDENKKYLII